VSIPIAAICAVRLTLLGFFTIVLWCEFSLYLLMELENSGLRMSGQAFAGNSEANADNCDGTRGFDLIFVGHESRRVGAENVVAEMDDGAAAQVCADDVISVQGENRGRCIDDHRLSVAGGHGDFRVGQFERRLVGRITCLTRGQDPLPLAGLHLGPVEIVGMQKRAGKDARDGLQDLGGGAMTHDPDGDGQQAYQGDSAEGGQGLCDTSWTHLQFSR